MDKSFDIFKLIKSRRAVRQYQDKAIARKILNKVVEAAFWGPSVHKFQPLDLVVIQDKDVISRIADGCLSKIDTIQIGANIILRFTIQNMAKAPALILAYNSKVFSKKKKMSEELFQMVRVSEVQGIAAAIQNIELSAGALGLGTCWLTTPLLCAEEINKILGVCEKDLVAIVTIGYPKKWEIRSPRQNLEKRVLWIDEKEK